MVSISSFSLEYDRKKEYFSIKTEEVVFCPQCGGRLRYRDSVLRNVKNLLSEAMRFLLRRLKCQACGKLHRELPNTICPYKHYEADVIQAVIDGSEEASSCSADDSTIRRWKSGFAGAEPDIIQRLSSVYARMAGKTVPITATEDILGKIRDSEKRWFPFVMGLLINNGHETCTEFAFFPPPKSARVGGATKTVAERSRENDKTTQDTG